MLTFPYMLGRPMALWLAALSATALAACDRSPKQTLTVYSGRSEILVQPLIDSFQTQTGVEVEVRYGGSSQLARTILEEGESSPADVYYGQDAGALGLLARKDRLEPLSAAVLDLVDAKFRSADGKWVGTSGRARVIAYATSRLSEDQLPDGIEGLTAPEWQGRVGWAPSNGSFQAFVTAMRLIEGEEKTRQWLEGMVRNDSKSYRDNTPLFEAMLSGEIDIALTNHYYLFRFLQEAPQDLAARNYSPRAGGPGALVNIAGAGVVDSSPHRELAHEFVRFLLSGDAQTYFATETFEYPLIDGVALHPLIQPLTEIRTPDIDLSELDDLEGTLAVLEQVGVR